MITVPVTFTQLIRIHSVTDLTAQTFLDTFKQYHRPIYGYVYLRTGRDQAVAEDLTQDVFVKAWQARDTFNSQKSSIKTWLYIIARNTIIDYWRKQEVSGAKSTEFNEENSGAVNEQNKLEAELMIKFVYTNLYKLDQLSQDLIIWRFIKQLDIEEIAEITGKNYNTTKVAIHRAIQKLKQIINV